MKARLLPVIIVVGWISGSQASADDPVRVHDDRLHLSLFAQEPDIVTPIGMVIDDRGRVFVLESHTHLPPSDYAGPKGDLIKVFTDADDDGSADGMTVLADGIQMGMNLAVSPDGVVYAVCAKGVWAYFDTDGDGVSESRRRVVELVTESNYPHSSLLSLTFSHDGWMYIGRGNTGGYRYAYRGVDGSEVTGFGDGGDVMKCRPDGSQLQRVATGFWNPFDLKFDTAGRLLLVDNDPDARGPNRLVHVVRGGDYGYKSLYGGGGNHPFQGWDGTLPGTLPMIDGTGEAPSGLLDCNASSLPVDYRDNLLVTVWNENRVDRYVTTRRGVSITASHGPLLSGGKNFRPVALDTNHQGDVFITDWVLVDYPNHGRGRIWRLSTRPGTQRIARRARYAPPKPSEAERRLHAMLEPDAQPESTSLRKAMRGDDPFMRHAAQMVLSRPEHETVARRAVRSRDPKVRLAAALALKRSGVSQVDDIVRRLLSDPNSEVRRVALMWAGEGLMMGLRDDLRRAIDFPDLQPIVFETYLAAVANLQPEFIAKRTAPETQRAKSIPRRLPEGLVRSIIDDAGRPVVARALAIPHLPKPWSEDDASMLRSVASVGHPILRRAAIRALAQATSAGAAETLSAIATDATELIDLRADALLALSWHQLEQPTALIGLLNAANAEVRREAVRTLRAYATNPTVRHALDDTLSRARRHNVSADLIELIEFALYPLDAKKGPTGAKRPTTDEAWIAAVSTGGDVKRGARVFAGPTTNCTSCHTMDGVGARLGPDLSNVGQSLDRTQIIRAILDPSEKFPPQYQAWTVITSDGRLFSGLQLDHKARGAIELYTTDGVTRRFEAHEIDEYAASKRSIMPDGLPNTMTVGEFRDLTAFLSSLK